MLPMNALVHGRIVSQDDVAKLLSDHHLKKIEDAGFISMDSPPRRREIIQL
jgi:hypothetical protein